MHTLSQVQSYRSVGILPIIPPGQFNDPLVALRTQILPLQFSLIGFGRRYGTVHRNHVPLLDARRQGGALRVSGRVHHNHPPTTTATTATPTSTTNSTRTPLRPRQRPPAGGTTAPPPPPTRRNVTGQHPRTIGNQEQPPQYRPTNTRMDRPGCGGGSEFVEGEGSCPRPGSTPEAVGRVILRGVVAPGKYSDEWTAERFSDPARLALRPGPGRRRGR